MSNVVTLDERSPNEPRTGEETVPSVAKAHPRLELGEAGMESRDAWGGTWMSDRWVTLDWATAMAVGSEPRGGPKRLR